MELSAATLSAFALFFCIVGCAAKPSHNPSSYCQTAKSSPRVQIALNWRKEFQTLQADIFIENKSATPSDQLVSSLVAFERNYGLSCGLSDTDRKFAVALKRAYLKKFGLAKVDNVQVDPLFRGLIVPNESAVPYFRSLLEKAGVTQGKRNAEEVLSVLGATQDLRGVIAIDFEGGEGQQLTKWVAQLCPKAKPCPLWDSRVLYKVMFTKQKGIAVFIPELATLILEHSLLAKPNLLHRLVFTHELVHVAEESVRYRIGRDLTEEFSAFSGWKKVGKTYRPGLPIKKKSVNDQLSKFSKGSAFSIAPDALVMPTEKLDGFAMVKTMRTSIAQGPGEDLADHVALFYVYPERFCPNIENVAPRKFKWIQELGLIPWSSKTSCF